MATAINLTKDLFLQKVYDYVGTPDKPEFKGSRPAVIDFYATWCGPCKMMHPILEEIASEYDGKVDVYKIDTDKEAELSSLFNIRSIPTFLFIPKEGKTQFATGAMSKLEFKNIIETVLLNKI